MQQLNRPKRGRHGQASRHAFVRWERRAVTGVATLAACAIALVGASPALAESAANDGQPVTQSQEPTTTSTPDTATEPTVAAPNAEAADAAVPESTEAADTAVDPAPVTETPATEAPAPEAPVSETPATDPLAAPFLRWTAVDATGAAVSSTAFTVVGARDSQVVADGTAEWAAAVQGTVADNTGQSDYVGADLDPTPGAFLVKQLASDADASVVVDIAAEQTFRVRPSQVAAGFQSGDAASWTEIVTEASADTAATQVAIVATPKVVTPTPTPTPRIKARASAQSLVTAAAAAVQPVCTAGYVYAVTSGGQMQQIAPNGTVTSFGSPASNVSNFNGLGISSGGTSAYAIMRSASGGTDQNGTVYVFNTATGTWSSTGANSGNTSTNLVAGAVSLSNGRYYFGGFTDGGNFRLYEYNPAASTPISFKGTIAINSGSAANGDIAFDAAGNLFVVRGENNTTTIYSVTAANLAAANGGTITAAVSASRTTMDSVNGVAFDASGKGYLGSSNEMRSYNMPGWSNMAVAATTGLSSTDLASCSSPPTITLEKFIDGQRVKSTDQFALTLTQGSQTIGTTTTTGTASGLQSQRVGPIPTVRGVELTFTETASGGTDLSQYASSYRCLVDGVQTTQGTTTTGKITIPAGGQAVECRFFNAPLVAQVTIHKDVTDVNGQNPTSRQGWTVGATATPASGSTLVASTNAVTQTTSAAGDASWSYTFGAKAQSATITVNEQNGADYEFQRGSCLVTHLDGTTATTTLTGPNATQIAGVIPGDRVDCTYVNRLKAPKLTLVKKMNNTWGGTSVVSDWTLTATGPTTISGKTTQAAVTAATVTAGNYTLTEAGPGGYTASAWTCTNGQTALTVSAAGVVQIANAADVTCTITNSDRPGAVKWSKTAQAGGALLNGSEWKITGPGMGASGTAITDCTATPCTGPDTDAAAGRFALGNLNWGTYTVTETKAPPGYVIGAQFTFTVDASNAGTVIDKGAQTNQQQSAVVVPLTGGLGADAFTLGGLGIAALAVITGLVARGIRRARTH